jgi:hypothetical protein
MTKAAERVVAGFANLSQQERNDAVTELNRLINAPPEKKKPIEESFAKRAGIDLGPTGEGKCPCCGR